MVDLHTHILPHLDDGAFDLETSVRMADLAARSGVFHMAAAVPAKKSQQTLQNLQKIFPKQQAETPFLLFPKISWLPLTW